MFTFMMTFICNTSYKVNNSIMKQWMNFDIHKKRKDNCIKIVIVKDCWSFQTEVMNIFLRSMKTKSTLYYFT